MSEEFFRFLASLYGKVDSSPMEGEMRQTLFQSSEELEDEEEDDAPALRHQDNPLRDQIEELRRQPGYDSVMEAFHLLEEELPVRAAALEARMVAFLLMEAAEQGNPALFDNYAYHLMLDRLRRFDRLCELYEEGLLAIHRSKPQ